MTAVEQFWQEIQDILPSSVDTETGIKMLRAFDKFKDIEKEQKIALLKSLVYQISGDDVEDVEEWLIEEWIKEHELNKSE